MEIKRKHDVSDGLSVEWRSKPGFGNLHIYKPGAEDIADSSSRLPRVDSFERKVKKPRMSIEKLA